MAAEQGAVGRLSAGRDGEAAARLGGDAAAVPPSLLESAAVPEVVRYPLIPASVWYVDEACALVSYPERDGMSLVSASVPLDPGRAGVVVPGDGRGVSVMPEASL
ncbi:MAG: hypothetical protein IPJ61_18640 [Tessaracoccus sp.]|uniref:hypothetical protein n=1 Tax=Tessaracoccus sp. TaxID=1971211 RepID=UPI001EB1AC97|nr:hypothetical protein [Tessaracoccus sp.]MBK7823003.1 hypothetical protein [Tessaracoccus sp.]